MSDIGRFVPSGSEKIYTVPLFARVHLFTASLPDLSLFGLDAPKANMADVLFASSVHLGVRSRNQFQEKLKNFMTSQVNLT